MPHVVISAAMATPSGFYRPLVESFESEGWSVSAVRTRGFDRGEPRASRDHDWSYADAIADIEEEIARVRRDGAEEVLLLGHSQGAQFGVGVQLGAHAADGFVAVGASNPHFRAFGPGGLGILALGLTVPVITRLAGYLPKPWFGAPGAATLMRQWASFARTGVPPFDVERPVTTPTLVIHLQGDSYAVSAANKAFTHFVDPAALTRWVYTKDIVPHAGTTHHLYWVKTPGVVVGKIIAWWASARVRAI